MTEIIKRPDTSDLASINIDFSGVYIDMTPATRIKYEKWMNKKAHKYGPFIIRLSNTGIGTNIRIKHKKTGHTIDVSNYEN